MISLNRMNSPGSSGCIDRTKRFASRRTIARVQAHLQSRRRESNAVAIHDRVGQTPKSLTDANDLDIASIGIRPTSIGPNISAFNAIGTDREGGGQQVTGRKSRPVEEVWGRVGRWAKHRLWGAGRQSWRGLRRGHGIGKNDNLANCAWDVRWRKLDGRRRTPRLCRGV